MVCEYSLNMLHLHAMTNGLTLILVIVDETVSITIKGGATILGSHLETDRCLLASLDKVSSSLIINECIHLSLISGKLHFFTKIQTYEQQLCTVQSTYVEVELGSIVNIIVDNLDGNGVTQERQELLELGSTNAVGTIQNQGRQLGLAINKGLEGSGQLLVVALSAGLAVSLGSAGSVEAASDVVELGGGQDTVISRLCIKDLKTIDKGVNKSNTARASVASNDNVGGLGEVDLQGADHGVNIFDQLLVRLGVGHGGRMSLPGTFKHLPHWVNQLDAIVLLGRYREK
jgi:hypothetical protein